MQTKRQPYPWDEWFNRILWPGDRMVLMAGSDFRCTEVSFIKMFRIEADRRGVRVRCERIRPTSLTIGVAIAPVFRSEPYPWGKWLDGERHVLAWGADFPKTMPLGRFLSMVHTAARRRWQSVDVEVRKNLVVVQAGPFLGDPQLPAVSAALEGIKPSTKHRLADIEALVAHLDPAPRARKLSMHLQELGWHYRRTASSRLWIAPAAGSNALECDDGSP